MEESLQQGWLWCAVSGPVNTPLVYGWYGKDMEIWSSSFCSSLYFLFISCAFLAPFIYIVNPAQINLKNIYSRWIENNMNLPVNKQNCRNTAAWIDVLPKGFTALATITAVSISEDRTVQDWTPVEQRKALVLQYHRCALKILNTKASVVIGV